MKANITRYASIAALVLAATAANALPLQPADTHGYDNGDRVFSFSNGDLAASATFVDLGGGNLEIYLRNTSLVPANAPEQVLHGVFFDVGNNPVLSGVSAEGQGDEFTGDMSAHWGFRNDLDTSLLVNAGGATHGISNVGYGVEGFFDGFSNTDAFAPGDSNDFPGQPQQYSIVPTAGFNLPGSFDPLVQDTARFNFTYEGEWFNLDEIGSVSFAYGTSLAVVPEPATMTMLGLGLAGLAARRIRRRQD